MESSFIPILDVIWEHRIYLPSVGLFIALTTGIYLLLIKYGQRKLYTIGVAIFMVVIIVFSVLTYSRNNIWSSEIALWQDNVEKSPQKDRPQNNLGLAFYNQGHIEKSIEHYLQALRINPESEKTHNNLGLAFYNQGRTKKAVEHYLHALRIKPDYEKAHYNLDISLVHIDNIERAIAHFRKALHINPDFVAAKNNLKKVLMLIEKQKQ